MTCGFDFYRRRLGIGFNLVWESYFKAGWISLGPLVFWVEF